jgi:hypothetical protein
MRTPFNSRRVATHHRDDPHAEGEPAQLKARNRVPRRVSMQKETPMAIKMPKIHHSRTAIAAFVAVLTFALSTPFAVNAEDQVLVEEPVLTAEDQVPALAPVAGPSWDETSGYGSVEASRAAHALAVVPETSTTQVPSDVRWAPARVIASGALWDETSGYGSVEASRAARASQHVVPAPVAVPTLSDASVTTQMSPLFTVTGTGFTAGGRVYLALYDQMGAQLYETRWITANLPLAAVMGPTGHEGAGIIGHGGTLRESFANLCGATAMMRAYDEATTTWSTWLTIEPACAASGEPTSGPR